MPVPEQCSATLKYTHCGHTMGHTLIEASVMTWLSYQPLHLRSPQMERKEKRK